MPKSKRNDWTRQLPKLPEYMTEVEVEYAPLPEAAPLAYDSALQAAPVTESTYSTVKRLGLLSVAKYPTAEAAMKAATQRWGKCKLWSGPRFHVAYVMQ